MSNMKWACLATPLLLLLVLAEARQVEVEDVTARQLEAATQTEDVLAVFWCKYTVKKAFRCFRPQPGCHLPNSPSAGIMTSYIHKLFPPGESLASDILSADGNIEKLFFTVYTVDRKKPINSAGFYNLIMQQGDFGCDRFCC